MNNSLNAFCHALIIVRRLMFRRKPYISGYSRIVRKSTSSSNMSNGLDGPFLRGFRSTLLFGEKKT